MKLILLGTGAVRIDMDHWGPAQVVQVVGENLLFDCGRGASMRLAQAGIPFPEIKKVFFTHHHYDHNCDFPYFFLTSWVMGRDFPLEIYGPRGTADFCRGLFETAYKDDIASRRGHPLYSKAGCEYAVKEILDKETVLDFGPYTVKIVHAVHKPPHIDNLAFRIEHGGKSLVVVGDTVECDQVKKLAQGCDLLVHECTFPTEIMYKNKWDAFHTSPKALGQWARELGVKKLVLKHFAIQKGVSLKALTDEVRSTFGNEGLIVGEDLMTVEVN